MKKVNALLAMGLVGCFLAGSAFAAAPGGRRIQSAGPRVGIAWSLSDLPPLNGQEIFPLQSLFGWQFEYMYEAMPGGPELLVEVIPLISGMEQSLILPQINALLGVRTSKGQEFGIGPHLSPNGIGLVIAIGTTFRTGGVNFPVNFAASLGRDRYRLAVVMGWNISQPAETVAPVASNTLE